MTNPSYFLCVAGIISFAIALLHIVIIAAGPKAYDYFGAGEDLVLMARRGSVIPPLLTIFIALVFAVFGLYAFSAADLYRDLPFKGPLVVIIGILYFLRGSAVFFQLLNRGSSASGTREIIFSLISFTAGICYLAGVLGNWESITGGPL
ncbi:hypothetical protein [Maridesulfovibrio bastinii]|uniref:hypothetical protein n=1 Tax=Maridesulfovibrio bastinii TaxID=47157 RepID=UPI00041C3D58|nr:hypothetical protein [Maridesulfovibrio bastinii]